MKKIFYWGILALMALLGLSGISPAQNILTFDPPSGEVKEGQEITIISPNVRIDPESGTYILYRLYPDMAEAQADGYLDGDVETVISSFKSDPRYVTYDEAAPKITQGNLVIKARVIDTWPDYEEWRTESFYAEYTIGDGGGSNIDLSVVFNPDPKAGEVVDETEITITLQGDYADDDYTLWYKLYASKSAAESDNVWDDPDNYDALTSSSVNPKVTSALPVIRVGILDGSDDDLKWVKTDYYAEYIIRRTTVPTLTFNPPSGSTMKPGDSFTITSSDPIDKPENIWFIVYPAMDSATKKADAAFRSWSGTFGNMAQIDANKITAENPVIAAAVFTSKANTIPLVIEYAEYKVTTTEPEPDPTPGGDEEPTLTFTPDPSVPLSAETDVTIGYSNYTSTSETYIYYGLFDSREEAETNKFFTLGPSAEDFWDNEFDYAYERPIKVTKAKRFVRAALFDIDDSDNWVCSDIVEYTFTNTEEPEPGEEISLEVSFTPPSGSTVTSGTECTITASHKGDPNDFIYYKTYASKEEAEAETWVYPGTSNLKNMGTGQTRTVELNNDAKVIKVAIGLKAGTEWSEFTYAVYTIKTDGGGSEPGTAPYLTFDPYNGAYLDAGDSFTVTCSDATNYPASKIYFKIYDGEKKDWIKDNKVVDAVKSDFTAFAQADFTGSDIYSFASGKNVAPELTDDASITVAAAIFNQNNEPFVIELAEYFVFAPTSIIEKPKAPTFSEPEGEVEKGTEISLSCETEGVKIYYTVDGKTPNWGESPLYDETPIVINATTTIKAYSVKDGQESDIVSATYTVKGTDPEPVEDPVLVFDPASGTEVEDGTKVMITAQNIEIGEDDPIFIYFGVYPDLAAAEAADIFDATDVEDIYNALWFDEEPSLWSTDMDTAVITEGKTVIRARLYNFEAEEWIGESFYAQYTLKGGETPVEPADTVATPTFSPVAGEVEKGTKVAISCATDGADIYYTLDGTTPNTNSIPYLAAITIEEDVTIKAIAVKEGMVASKVAESSYTVKEDMANEDAELAGVNIYPNPNDGKFNVTVPVNVTVEVFNTKAQLVFRAELVTGVHSLQLANSGIYFVRFTSENAQTIKRVIVR